MEDKKYFALKRCSNSELGRIKRELLGMPPYAASEATLLFGRTFHTASLETRKYDPIHVDMESRKLIKAMTHKLKKNFQFNLMVENQNTFIEEVHLFTFKGIPFKIKLDMRLVKWGADLKSTATSSRDEFISKFDDYGYWRQAVIYMKGAGCTKFTFFGVTKNEKNCQVFTVNAHDYPHKLKEGQEEADLLMLHYAKKHGLKTS